MRFGVREEEGNWVTDTRGRLGGEVHSLLPVRIGAREPPPWRGGGVGPGVRGAGAFPSGGGTKGGGKPDSAASHWLVLSRRVSRLGHLQREML